MNWTILVFLVSCAVALPQNPQYQSRKVVHRRVPVAAVSPHAASGIPPPVKVANSAKRTQSVRVVRPNAIKANVAVPGSLRTPIAPPVRTGVKRVTAIKRVPAIKPYPGIKTLSREEHDALQRQIQQWQIAVMGGAIPPPGPPGPSGPPGSGAPPGAYPSGPGTIWIQVPSGPYPYPSGGFPSQPPPAFPPASPEPVQPGPVVPPIPAEAQGGSEQPVPEPPVGEEGVPPEEETSGGEAPAGEVPAEGVAPEEEMPTEEGVAPEEVPAAPEGEAPAEEVPPEPEAPAEGVAPEEEVPEAVPEGEAPAEEIPSGGEVPAGGEAPAGGEMPTMPGDEQEDKLIYCKEKRGQFAHESSCSKFYNCWDDVVVEQSCPNGLAFSEEHSYCDFPENVDCGEKTLETPEMPIEEMGGCATPYATYRSKTNCSEFFICVNSNPIKFACPATLSYNEDLGVCDYPYRVDCVNPPAPETPAEEPMGGDEAAPETPEEPPAEPAPPAEDPASTPDDVRGLPPGFLKAGSPCWHNNVYPLNRACSRVSVCRSGVTSILACPKGMAYDKYKRRCLPYYRVRC